GAAAGGAAPGAPGPRAHAGGALRGADGEGLEAVLRQRRQPRRRAPREIPLPVPPRRLHLRALARAHRPRQREHGAALYDPPARILSGVTALERGAPRPRPLAGARGVGRAAAPRQLRRAPLERRLPPRDAAGGG